MHDEQGSASPSKIFFSNLPQSDTGEIHPTFPRPLDPHLDMPGGGDQPLGNIISTDQPIDVSPTNRLDIRPADECSTRNQLKGSASSTLDESRGREAWVVLGAVTAALVVGFGGGLASYRYLIPEAPRGLQHANSSVPIEKSESTSPKAAMLSRSPTPGVGLQSLNASKDPGPKVSASYQIIPSPAAAQPNVASGDALKSVPGNAVKTAAGNAVKPATQPTSLPRPGTLEREAVLQPVPETRPITIEGWIVRDVRGDAIVLQGPNGVRNVMRGETVPGVGRIDSVVRWGNRWVVSTTSGLIATP